MNQTLKLQLSKICQKTSMTWIQALPLALPRITIQPKGKHWLSPYKLLCGRPYQIPKLPGELNIRDETDLRKYLICLGTVMQEMKKNVVVNKSLNLDSSVHLFQPGNWVYLKSWTEEPLQAKWKGPFQVLFTRYTDIKLDNKDPGFITQASKGLLNHEIPRRQLLSSSFSNDNSSFCVTDKFSRVWAETRKSMA